MKHILTTIVIKTICLVACLNAQAAPAAYSGPVDFDDLPVSAQVAVYEYKFRSWFPSSRPPRHAHIVVWDAYAPKSVRARLKKWHVIYPSARQEEKSNPPGKYAFSPEIYSLAATGPERYVLWFDAQASDGAGSSSAGGEMLFVVFRKGKWNVSAQANAHAQTVSFASIPVDAQVAFYDYFYEGRQSKDTLSFLDSSVPQAVRARLKASGIVYDHSGQANDVPEGKGYFEVSVDQVVSQREGQYEVGVSRDWRFAGKDTDPYEDSESLYLIRKHGKWVVWDPQRWSGE